MVEHLPQAEPGLRHVRQVRAVHTAADPDETIVVTTFAVTPDRVDLPPDDPLSHLIGMPVRQDVPLEVIAVVAPAPGTELDARVGGVHDAMGTDRVRALGDPRRAPPHPVVSLAVCAGWVCTRLLPMNPASRRRVEESPTP